MTFSVTNYIDDWYDAHRNRTIPVRIFLPERELAKPLPIVLLSHGLAGNRDGFGYLGDNWAKHGYLVVVMQHPGSDSETQAVRQSGETPLQAMARTAGIEEAQHRADDVKFILDELERRNTGYSGKNEKLAGKIDMNRVGIGGHSFGSQTAFASVGRSPFKADPRIKTAIVMSPSIPKDDDPILVHKNIKTPILHLTGTSDRSPIRKDFNPVNRRIPFDSITGADQYLIVFTDGNHTLFSGHRRPFGLSMMEKKCQPIIAEITWRFLDAYLQDDVEVQTWLRETGLAELIKGHGTVEMKK